MADLMFPDIAGNAQQQYALGQQQQANRLIGQAFSNPGQQTQLLGQAAAVDPQAAMSAQQYFQQQQSQQDAAQQSQQAAQLKKIGGAARYMLGALQTKDPNQIEGAYQAVKPYLAELGQAQGKVPPDHWDPSMEQAVYQVAAQTAQAFPDDSKLQVLGPGSTLLRGTNPVYTNPYAPKYENAVPFGSGTAAGVFDPNTRSLTPIGAPQASQPTQPAPQADPMNALIAQANQMVQSGANPDQVQTWLVQQAQGGGMQPQASGMTQVSQVQPASSPQAASPPAQFGVSAPKRAAAPSGYAFQADGSLAPIPGGPADKKSAGVPGDTSQSGDAYLQSIPDQGLRNMIQAISEGRMQVPRIYRASNGQGLGPTEIAAAVNQYDPSFNAGDYTARAKTYSGFTSGKEAQQINALSTVAQHLQTLSQAASSLNNTSYPMVNAVANSVESQGLGDPRVARFNLARDAVSKELERVWRGTGGSETGIQQWQQDLGANASPQQQQGAINQLISLVQGKIGALKNQYVQGMGRSRNALQLLPPDTQAIFANLNPQDATQIANDATAQNPIGGTPPAGWSISKVQ